jgi:hypothetical protein
MVKPDLGRLNLGEVSVELAEWTGLEVPLAGAGFSMADI